MVSFGPLVNWRAGVVPSVDVTQIVVCTSSSSLELVLTTKATFVPSGDKRGSVTVRSEKKSSGCMPRVIAAP
jgi:hypothetical protein